MPPTRAVLLCLGGVARVADLVRVDEDEVERPVALELAQLFPHRGRCGSGPGRRSPPRSNEARATTGVARVELQRVEEPAVAHAAQQTHPAVASERPDLDRAPRLGGTGEHLEMEPAEPRDVDSGSPSAALRSRISRRISILRWTDSSPAAPGDEVPPRPSRDHPGTALMRSVPMELRLTGAAVSVRSRGTLDSDTLEGILRCGLARAAASAENGPGVADPIAVSGASARIRPAADKSALTVEFRSLDPDRAAEILRRAQALARSEL